MRVSKSRILEELTTSKEEAMIQTGPNTWAPNSLSCSKVNLPGHPNRGPRRVKPRARIKGGFEEGPTNGPGPLNYVGMRLLSCPEEGVEGHTRRRDTGRILKAPKPGLKTALAVLG